MNRLEFLELENKTLNKHKGELIEKVWGLEDENKRLREALEFYAKEENNHHKNWFTVGEWEMLSKVTKDKGETARKALGGEGIDIPSEG